MRRIATYKKPFTYIGTWNWETLPDHKRLLEQGWKVVQVEDTKEWSAGKTLVYGVLFLPLALLGKSNAVKVTYDKE